MPRIFHGNPVKSVPRSHSLRVSPNAKAKMRPAPGDQNRRAKAKLKAGKKASAAGRPSTPKGSAQAKTSASTRKAAPSHHSPATKYPNPHHQPMTAADRRVAIGRPLPAAAPSMSQTATVSERARAGRKPNGGIASAPA